MTQDSSSAAYLKQLENRFASATKQSFRFLEEAGFSQCPLEAKDLHEYRDAEFRITYIRENRAIRVVIGLSNLQILVGVYTYSSEACCSETKKATQAINLDRWIEQHGPISPLPLAWMKTQTFDQEVLKNYRRFFKHVDEDLEGAVEFMALRLRSSALYKT